MSCTYAKGWAVADDRGLLTNTVSSTRRSAIIRWLFITEVIYRDDYSDDEIEYLWQRYGTNPNRALVHKVKISSV